MEDLLLRSGNFVTGTLDYVLVVDRNYQVLYNNRYDPRMQEGAASLPLKGVGRNFFEVYPQIKRSESSIVETMNTGRITERIHQRHVDFDGKVYFSNNITVPIIREGIIIGAIELVRDVTTVASIDRDRENPQEPGGEERGMPFFCFDDILTRCPDMMELKRRAELFASSDKPTLIYGETGTGKELFAQSMILRSGVPRDKVVVQNCAAVPETLLETTLFGSCKGAFTGAERVAGLFEQADGGILFLDELNSMSLPVQGKLLRVLQDGRFRPVGSEKEKCVCVKVIATVNVDPLEAMESGILRKDLFYRFSSSLLCIPPLRERREDILFCAEMFLREASKLYGKKVRRLAPPLQSFLLQYAWPGNVRELKHLVESMVSASAQTELGLNDLPAYLYNRVIGKTSPESLFPKADKEEREEQFLGLGDYLEQTEREYIRRALGREGYAIGKTAQRLQIPRQTLRYKMRKLGL